MLQIAFLGRIYDDIPVVSVVKGKHVVDWSLVSLQTKTIFHFKTLRTTPTIGKDAIEDLQKLI